MIIASLEINYDTREGYDMKWEDNVRKVVPYVPGEQPNKPNMIKLNKDRRIYGEKT